MPLIRVNRPVVAKPPVVDPATIVTVPDEPEETVDETPPPDSIPMEADEGDGGPPKIDCRTVPNLRWGLDKVIEWYMANGLPVEDEDTREDLIGHAKQLCASQEG